MNTTFLTIRSSERILLVIAQLIAFTGILAVSLSAGVIDKGIIASVAVLFLLWFAVHFLLCRYTEGNQFLLPIALMLSALGLIAVYRLKPELILSQILWNTIGLAAFAATALVCRRLEKLADYKYLMGIVGIGLLLSAILFGVDIGGNKNWVILGNFRFQPSELAKLFVVLFLAAYLTERREVLAYETHRLGPIVVPKFRFAAPLLLFWGLTMLMLVFQRDLGTALLYYGTALAMIYIAANRISYWVAGMILFLSGAMACYYLYPHVQTRINIWLHPWADPGGAAYQIVQSLFALGSGGIMGTGLGYGFPRLIPEVHTDFVFAALGEELGFLGSAAIIISYMLLLTIAFAIALGAKNPFRQLTAAGLAIFLGLQVVLIIGGVTKFMPLTGVTLPFISYGGSSLVSGYILLGILFAASGREGQSAIGPMNQTIRTTAFSILGLLVILLTYICYLQLIASDWLASHPLNKRTAYMEMRMERGAIVDKSGKPLAYSQHQFDGTWTREYPLGAAAAPVTGYKSSRYGLAGLEASYHLALSGLKNPQNRLGPVGRLFQDQAGQTVKVTIDIALQQVAYGALGNRRGAVVAIDPKTGALLALVSCPAVDPAQIDQNWDAISASSSGPLLNRAVEGLYPPGSIIKVLVAEAALGGKAADLKTQFTCDGKLILGPDYTLTEAGGKKHGTVDLEDALAVSCNVAFGQLALKLGRDTLSRSYSKYGFTKPTGSDVAGQSAKLPDFSRLSDGDLAQAGIGQGSLLVTPLHMALMTAAIANKGTIMEPYLVQTITGPGGSLHHDHKPEVRVQPVAPHLAETISKMMVTTVNYGTATAARISGIEVAGKTGTAENPHGDDHAWFIGFAPAEDPQIVVAVLIENGGFGGSAAAPIGRQVLAQALR